MDILDSVFGGSHGVALFGLNVAASREEIEAAQRDANVYGQAAERLVAKVGLREGHYVAEQPVFGPLVRLMALAGWTFGGSGFFAAAFYKGGLTIKISLRGSSDAALDYLKWARDNDDLPGVPRLYAMGEHEYTYTVLMERYESARPMLSKDSEGVCHVRRAEYAEVKGVLENGDRILHGGFATSKTAEVIRERFQAVGRFDMHHGNVMLDRDGNMVITDPLGRSEERTKRYGGYSYYSNDNTSQAA